MSRAPRNTALPLAFALLASLPAYAQDAATLFQSPQPAATQQRKSLRFAGDALSRHEWTRDEPDSLGGRDDTKRWRLLVRPRLELDLGPFSAALGAAVDYSRKPNDELEDGTMPFPMRDNFRTREIRLDRAYGRLKLGPLAAQGGRFPMPLPLTEMIWDHDLRPLGGAARIGIGTLESGFELSATGIYATHSHVFEDESEMFGGGAEMKLVAGQYSSVQLAGSYLQFEDLDTLEPAIMRQNTRAAGVFAHEYRVLDGVARYSSTGSLPLRLTADYCWNSALRENNRGLWLMVGLGDTSISRAQLEYTYAKVDREATVAAFNTDDYLWGTGWEGHRADVAVGTTGRSTIHAIAQWQRFKDSPDPATAALWVKRWRLELRTEF